MPRPRRDGTTTAALTKRTITDLYVRKAVKRDRAYLVWDTRQPALALQVQPTGHRAWKCIYRFHGRPRWYHIGDASKLGVKDARKLATGLVAQVANEIDPQAVKRSQRGSGTFGELRERYVEEYAKKKNKSWKQAVHLVRKHLAPRWDKLTASKITKGDVKAVFRSLEATPILANQVLAAGSAIFSWAMREEVAGVTVNPCSRIERNETDDRERVVSDAEMPKVWAALRDLDPVKAMALRTVLFTGARPGEVSAMRREHVVDGWWLMPGEVIERIGWPGLKNKKSHRVWLSKPVREWLDLENGEGFVFASVNGNSIGPLDDAMRDLSAALGLNDEESKITPHDLRRTTGTSITRLKFGRDAMDRILNHVVKKKVTNVYDRYGYADEDRHIMETVAVHLMTLASGTVTDNKVLPFRTI
jgi:integrase